MMDGWMMGEWMMDGWMMGGWMDQGRGGNKEGTVLLHQNCCLNISCFSRAPGVKIHKNRCTNQTFPDHKS